LNGPNLPSPYGPLTCQRLYGDIQGGVTPRSISIYVYSQSSGDPADGKLYAQYDNIMPAEPELSVEARLVLLGEMKTFPAQETPVLEHHRKAFIRSLFSSLMQLLRFQPE
jgi:hypothetical protein